jgi:flagellar assembly protein FliH
MIEPPRRPRFLASVPGQRQAEPARFGRADRPPARTPARAFPPEQEGESAGPQLVAEARREALEKVARAMETLRAQAARLAEQARTDALEIGFQVARKILETEVRTSTEPLFALVKTALRRAGDSRRVTLRLCPDDAARIQAAEPGSDTGDLSSARVEVVPDPGLQPGDCLVETDYGQIDGRVETRLAELQRAVEGAGEGAA